jgi:hypothetical protein
MPSSFDSAFDSFAAPNLRQHFGAAMVYTSEGVDTPFTGMATDEETEEEIDGGRQSKTTRDVTIDRSEIESPREDAVITIDGVSYAIERFVARSDVDVIARVVRIESIERSKPKYRG